MKGIHGWLTIEFIIWLDDQRAPELIQEESIMINDWKDAFSFLLELRTAKTFIKDRAIPGACLLAR
jgi:hypothetical protein